jgi:hypothetical protein
MVMAKGINQEHVNAAADTLVASGERPTVERVRALHGSGSPNTVGRLLEVWWSELGGRLAAQQVKVDMPQAPAPVAALASQLWEQALLAARVQANAELASDRQALDAKRAACEEERAAHTVHAEAQLAAVAGAQQAQALAEARFADSQRLVEQQAAQLADTTQQRDALQARNERLDKDLAALAARLQHQEVITTADRETQAKHLREIENRAHAEVDRARQESKALRVDLTKLDRERDTEKRQSKHQSEEAQSAVVLAQRDAAKQQARADALEQQLARLGDLPAALQSSLANALKASEPRAAKKRKPVPVPTARAK